MGGRKTNLAHNEHPAIGQHFDGGISIKKRMLQKMARFLGYDATYKFPTEVAGAIGQLAGAFLMQLIGSPVTRQAYAHLWSYGAPAIHNGDGTATPILDAWANKDTDIAPLTVDVGTQSVSAGDFGIIMQPTNPNAQTLVFFKGAGGGSAGGAPGIWGDGSDGNLALDGSTGHFLYSSAGTGGRLYGIDTEAMTNLGSGNTDPMHYYLNRDVHADTITLSPGVTLHTAGWILWAYEIIGDNTTAIDFSPESYYQACRTDPTLGYQVGFDTGGGYTFTMGKSGSGGNAANQGGVPAVGIPLENGTYRFYGRGGDGGAGATQPGGWRNTIPPVINPHYRHFPPFNYGDGFTGVNFHGGAGGGGGDTTAGGAGGGPMLVLCRDLSGFEGVFRTEGAKGFATTGVNKTGPGGGGGGHQRIFSLIDGPFTTSVAGGLGRAGTGSGAAGSDGYPGLCVRSLIV